MTDRNDWTDDLLNTVARQPVEPDADFMARLMSDAATVQPRPHRQGAGVKKTLRESYLAIGRRWIWPSGGLAAGLACGIWLGLSPQSVIASYLHDPEVAVEPYNISDIYAALEEAE